MRGRALQCCIFPNGWQWTRIGQL